nr:SAM-dependent chlorinase/fluorinase [Marinithermus hydrothermalis]
MAMQGTPRTVFFLSDFGVEDAYVGIVKAVMEGIAPGVRIVDLAHALPPQDLRRAAYQLYEAVPYLPQGAVVLAVVDPGVGSSRRGLVVVGERLVYVAPDNGLLTLAWLRDPPRRAYALENPAYRLPGVSATFHGRDVFGPAAAHLARGVPPEAFGAEVPVAALQRLPVRLGRGPGGEVLTFDRFGNAITTIQAPLPPGVRAVEVAGRPVPLARYYAEVAPGAPLALVGSSGLVEVSVREGSAREALGLREGDPVRLVGL